MPKQKHDIMLDRIRRAATTVEIDWDRLAAAADLAHREHDGVFGRATCRHDVCRAFEDAGL
jgi:hypothetical protein